MCPEVSDVRLATLAVRSDDPAHIDMTTNALARCYEQLVGQGIDPAQYNYIEAAKDVLDLMAALHINQADFTSYGTNGVIVFSIMRQAPAAVRSITLDNPTAPGESTATDPIGDLAGSFGRFDAMCKPIRRAAGLSRSRWRLAHEPAECRGESSGRQRAQPE